MICQERKYKGFKAPTPIEFKRDIMSIILTGGCGFIGTNFIREWLLTRNERLINIDKITYAANCDTAEIQDKNYKFFQLDIIDTSSLLSLIRRIKPRAIIHFAAETHVDRSITTPEDFVLTNINGTYSLLEASLDYFLGLSPESKSSFKVINISTDEVYGALSADDLKFTEQSALAPNSPYSASKASADMLARSFFKTYGLPVITTRCSNNFGPFQNDEKFIPKILKAINFGQKIPVYGKGTQIRDWLYVLDHVKALLSVLDDARAGSVFNIGGGTELENITLARLICKMFARKLDKNENDFLSLITFVDDRQGHDFRYAIDSSFIHEKLGWSANHDFNSTLSDMLDQYISVNQLGYISRTLK